MPPAFFVPNTARHCHPRRWPPPLQPSAALPSLFPVRSVRFVSAPTSHATAALAAVASTTPNTPFHGPIAADLAKVI